MILLLSLLRSSAAGTSIHVVGNETKEVTTEHLVIDEISFVPFSRLTFKLKGNQTVQRATVIIAKLNISAGAKVISPSTIQIVVAKIMSSEESAAEFLFGGNATYYCGEDLPMDLGTSIRFADTAIFRFTRYDDPHVVNKLAVSIKSLTSRSRWTIPHFYLPEGHKLVANIPMDFLKFQNRERVAQFSTTASLMATVCSPNISEDLFRLSFVGDVWAHRWQSFFEKVLGHDHCVGIRISHPFYHSVHCLQGISALSCESLFPTENVSSIYDNKWPSKLPPSVKSLTVFMTGSGAKFDLNAAPLRNLSIEVIGHPSLDSPRAQLIYDNGVTEAKVGCFYLENVDFSVFSSADHIKWGIPLLTLGKRCKFTDRTFLRLNWSLGGKVYYDVSLLADNALYRLPNALPKNADALSRVVTDFVEYSFVFESEGVSLAYTFADVSEAVFPFRLSGAPLLLNYRENLELQGIYLNVSRIVLDNRFMHCHQPLDVTFSGMTLIVMTGSQILPFSFDRVANLTVIPTDVDSIEVMGKFAVAPNATFSSFVESDLELHFWRDFSIGSETVAVIDHVTFWGVIYIGSASRVTINRSRVTGEVHFDIVPNRTPSTVFVNRGSDFLPDAVYIDIQAGHNELLNRSYPLICGHFDCPYVQARGRFAILDQANGFYLFKGDCQAVHDQMCYFLTSIYTPNTAAGMDATTIAMISSIAVVVALAITGSLVFAYILLKKRKESQRGIDERAAMIEMPDPR
jgi:hypothetical protein